MPSVKAKYESYCFVCENKVLRGQIVWMTKYIEPSLGEEEVAWRHPQCVLEQDTNEDVLSRK